MALTKTDGQVAREWLFAQAATVGVLYQDYVPEGVTGSALSARFLSGTTIGRRFGGLYCWSDLRYLVEVSSETETYATLEAQVAALQELLDAQAGTVTNGVIHACQQMAPFQQAEVEPGSTIKRLGAEYLLSVKGS